MSSRTGAAAALPEPPQNLEAERSVLGAVLLADSTLDALAEEQLQPGDFYRESHGRIYRAMVELHAAGEPADVLTIAASLERAGELERLGGRAAIDALAGTVPAVGNVRQYARIVRDMALLRRLLRLSYGLQADVHNRAAAARELVQQAHDQLQQLDDSRVASEQPDQWDQFVTWYEAERKGWPLPFDRLTDAIGGGLQPGEGTMLGGWPGMGKTFLLKDMLIAAAAAGARCHEFANEMYGPLRTARLLATLTGIPTTRMRKKSLSPDDWRKVAGHLAELEHGRPYGTTATDGWSVDDYVRAILRGRYDVAAIDHVSKLPCSKVDEWDRAATRLFDAAAQAGTHLILVCQLNLGRDTGAMRPVPTGRDLRSTGAWYHNARVVMFVHRDQELRDGIPVELPEGHIRVDKATHGDASQGFVQVYFNVRWARFDRLVGVGEWQQEAVAS